MGRPVGSVYVAASSADIERGKLWMKRLGTAGIIVTSTWPGIIEKVGDANPREATDADRGGWASKCELDIREADLVWFLVHTTAASRGAYFEIGFASALGKKIVCSGDTKQSIFTAQGEEFAEDIEAFAHICKLVRVGVE